MHNNIHMDFKHSGLQYYGTHREMELDVYIPSLNLAIEYQGEQHYMHHHVYGSPEEQRKRDEEKYLACERLGLTLIHVPFWWDLKRSSIIATIHKYRPDISAKYFKSDELFGNPIANVMPNNFLRKIAPQQNT